MVRKPRREAAREGRPARFPWLAVSILAGLGAARAFAAFAPGEYLWGIDLLRWLPAWAWGLWAVSIVALAPPVARRVLPALEGFGRRLATGVGAGAALPLVAALVVLALPDRTHFIGDSLLRYDAVQEGVPAAELSPQELPLDVALHWRLPEWLRASLGVSPAVTSRALGALEAAALAAVALFFGRALGLTGAPLVAAAALAWCGGWLALFTGFGKAFSELVVLAAATSWLALEAARGKRAIALGAVVAAALVLHRSALGLVPGALLALALGARRSPRQAAVAILLPIAASIWVGPKILAAAARFDVAHFAGPAEGPAGALARLFAPLRLLDLANAALLLVPLLPSLPVLALSRRGSPDRAAPSDRLVLVALLAPFALALFALRPAQGIFRDLDDYSAGAALAGFWLAAETGWAMTSRRLPAWLTAGCLVGAAAPTLEWLALQSDLARSLERVQAISEGPPLRSADERARTWDFLGGRRFRAGDYAPAARDLGRAVALAPSPRLVMGWARAAARAHDWETAERAYHLLYERSANESPKVRAAALYGLAGVALNRGDLVLGRRYLEQSLAVWPEYEGAARMLERVAEEERARAGGDSSRAP